MELVVLNCRGNKISVDKESIKNHGFFEIFFKTDMKEENEEIFLNHDHKIVHKLLNYLMGYPVDFDEIKDITHILCIDIPKYTLMAINSYEIKQKKWNYYVGKLENYNIDIDSYIKVYSEYFNIHVKKEILCVTQQLIIKSYNYHLDLLDNEDINISIYNYNYSGSYIAGKNYKAKSNDDYFYIYRLILEGTCDIKEYAFKILVTCQCWKLKIKNFKKLYFNIIIKI